MLGTSKSISGFDPRTVPGCQLWLDGADTGSMTLSGSNVTQWNDKSGNGYVMTNNRGTTTIATASLNSLTTVYTPSGTNTRITNFVGRTKCTIFLVGKAASSRYLLALNGGFLYTANDSLLYFSPPTGDYLDLVDSVSGSIVSNNTWFILCIGYDNATNSTANPYTINGTTRSTAITPRGTPGILTDQNITSTLYINSVNGTNSYDSVYTAEILYYNDTLTTTQRQQVEGYLAQKWGLQTSIPSTHPFYSVRPHLRAFQPIDVSGCQLWLDGADQSSMTLSGSSVTQWSDKSGRGFNATTPAGTNSPTYLTATRELQFVAANTNVLRIAQGFGDALVGTTYSIFFIGRRTVASGFHFFLGSTGNFGGRVLLMTGFFDNTMQTNVYDSAFNSSITTYTSPDPVRLYCYEVQSSSLATHILNGTQIGSDTQNYTLTSFANPELGRRYGDTLHTFNLSEMIAFSPALNASQRQQVEGYLAHKWGLSLSVPSTHSFKSFPPASLYFEPATKYSALFNNTSLTIPSSSSVTLGTNNHTIEFWAYQTSRGQYDCPFQYSTNTSAFSTSSYYMAIGGYLGILIGNNAGNFAVNMGATVSPLPSLNRWHHYAIVRNGTTFTIYINGISRETATSSVSIGAQGGSFIFGDVSTTTNTPFFGYITNFRLVNGTAVYTSNFIPSTSPLTAIPNTQILLQGLVDRSANAFTVTNNRGVTLSTLSPFPPP